MRRTLLVGAALAAAVPLLLVKDAGHGETPLEPSAKFKLGDMVRVRGGRQGAVACVIPKGFPPEWAMADLQKKPRPLVTTKPKAGVSYIVGFENDRRPYLYEERTLRPGKGPPAVVKWGG